MTDAQTAPSTSMAGRLIDGKAASLRLRETIRGDVEAFIQSSGVTPGLAVVIVGDNPASASYVRNKHKAATDAGITSWVHRLPESVSEAELLEKVEALNNDKDVHGILVQLPLPAHIEADKVIDTIDPAKDVDGFHVKNAGQLFIGNPVLTPCTPKGCMILLKETLGENGLKGKHAVIVGRSNIVGKPMAALLLAADCTVTVIHSRTENPEELCLQADIVIAAVGRAGLLNQQWIKPGATVIDVGINRVETIEGKGVLVGDVDFEAVSSIAAHITPVPGGVGPMTVACLLDNTLIAAKALQH